jgi:hypothetical protein
MVQSVGVTVVASPLRKDASYSRSAAAIVMIEEDQRLRDGHMRADSRQRLLLSPQHTQETPTPRRKDDTCGARRLRIVCTEIGGGASRNRDKRSETEGDFLWHRRQTYRE